MDAGSVEHADLEQELQVDDGGHIISADELAALENSGTEDLRLWILRLLQENHQLAAQLRRRDMVNRMLHQDNQRRDEDVLEMTSQVQRLSERVRSLQESKGTLPSPPVTLGPRQARAANQPTRSRDEVSQSSKPLGRDHSMSISVKIMPGVTLPDGQWIDELDLQLPEGSTPSDVETLLVSQGISRESSSSELLRPLEGSRGGCRLLFRGVALRHDLSLRAQGVTYGSELRLLRPRCGLEQLRCKQSHILAARRGLLLVPDLPQWTPRATRRCVETFRKEGTAAEFSELSALALAKEGKVKPDYYST